MLISKAIRALWPDKLISEALFARHWDTVRPRFLGLMREHQIPNTKATELAIIYIPLAAWVMERYRKGETFLLGVNGAQGSGKSTLCDFLVLILTQVYGKRVVGFSIDDLYKTRAEREVMAQEIHPLFRTRGVPGTHDVDLGLATLQKLRQATLHTLTSIPSFNKAMDDRRPVTEWKQWRGPPDIVILEGGCVGSMPERDAALLVPMNELERTEDPYGQWRRYANEALKGPYAELFRQLDCLIMLKVPDLDSVIEWRTLQERKLEESTPEGAGTHIMDEAAIRRFVMHWERLTRHNLEEMPKRADLTLVLDKSHRIAEVLLKPSEA
jgi:D-glycerate 3-kinase